MSCLFHGKQIMMDSHRQAADSTIKWKGFHSGLHSRKASSYLPCWWKTCTTVMKSSLHRFGGTCTNFPYNKVMKTGCGTWCFSLLIMPIQQKNRKAKHVPLEGSSGNFRPLGPQRFPTGGESWRSLAKTKHRPCITPSLTGKEGADNYQLATKEKHCSTAIGKSCSGRETKGQIHYIILLHTFCIGEFAPKHKVCLEKNNPTLCFSYPQLPTNLSLHVRSCRSHPASDERHCQTRSPQRQT